MAPRRPSEQAVAEASRIAEQHAYITAGLGFLIHPTVANSLAERQQSLRIADISEGLQFPPVEDVRWQRISKPLVERIPIGELLRPKALSLPEGHFDIVAVRLAHLNIGNELWDVAISNLVSLLRPGGWLQWTDWDPRTARIAGVKPGASDIIVRELLHRFADILKEGKVGTTYRISASLQSHGLENVDSDMYPLAPDVELTRNIASAALSHLEVAGAMPTGEVAQLREAVEEEITASDALIWYDLWCHIAQKP